jgi:hypothetical protein
VHQSPIRIKLHITRPALGHKRLRRTPAGAVVLQLKTPYRDGTTHLVMTPLEFLQRLAALVPRPRLHLIRFHAVLAPNAALRSQIVPSEADQALNIVDADGDRSPASTRARMSWAQLLKRVFAIAYSQKTHPAFRHLKFLSFLMQLNSEKGQRIRCSVIDL